ncbi:hypothetical protein GCM10017786_54720 [Amycolatopsis deserti]|uniref:Uncharacterized protein n=1 Tax=Amycolatopsis deserti TaxID=185696 RepID=A0ABQ3J9S4_9PSEU|nr:hypothetical protein [Amycolatopsis deserti]GHF14090.1 hypothetical protein GCM10017786_54720 [Amycolatopsis deserti]
MSDATDIDKAEYDSLRAESLFHQTNASAIFGLNLVGLGIGITASSRIDAALVVLGVFSCVLWSRYCDHLMSVFRIAAYVDRELRPRLVTRLGEAVLGWESFLRATGGDRMPPIPSTDSRIGFFVALFAFLLPPPLLCVVFTVQRFPLTSAWSRTLLIAAVAVVGAVWLHAIWRGRRVNRWIRRTDAWIRGS